MKIGPLLVTSATALETSTSASALLAAVGKRNVTHMEALVQGLAEESINEPGWKFDKDIQDALTAIRTMFVKSIQDALMEQHKVDQEEHNCQVKDCWDACKGGLKDDLKKCGEYIHVCHQDAGKHEACRLDVYHKYVDMKEKCCSLENYEPPKVHCPSEECICKDLLSCTKEERIQGSRKWLGTAWSEWEMGCTPTDGNCKSDPEHGYGAWLTKTIAQFEASHFTWKGLHEECSAAYKAYLEADLHCDEVQKEFEMCMCRKSHMEGDSCSVTFDACNQGCWNVFQVDVPHIQCLEKDRKIDWSATKKIECYLDVLLHDYTKKELLEDCGTEDCINIAREKAYKRCSTICIDPDHAGTWPEVVKDEVEDVCVSSNSHEFRKEHDQYHLGDSVYKCDNNGHTVHTEHRGGGKKRQDEPRCTEHLDIDYQTPPPPGPCEPTPRVCGPEFLCTYYAKFDNYILINGTYHVKQIEGLEEHCPACSYDDPCPDSYTKKIETCADAEAYKAGGNASTVIMEFGPHSQAWGYNRCPCKLCDALSPELPEQPPCRDACQGVHSSCFGQFKHAYN